MPTASGSRAKRARWLSAGCFAPTTGGQAFRTIYNIAKNNAADENSDVDNETERQHWRRRSEEPAEDENDESIAEVALRSLELRAKQLRAADPSLTKEQSFAKAYCDPNNRDLVAAERRSAMKKLGL
jgi:hypothetical protein